MERGRRGHRRDRQRSVDDRVRTLVLFRVAVRACKKSTSSSKAAYSRDRIEVVQGRPDRLNVRRKETTPCTRRVVFGDFGIVRDVPVGEIVPVEFTVDEPGENEFHCRMNMVRGRIVVN